MNFVERVKSRLRRHKCSDSAARIIAPIFPLVQSIGEGTTEIGVLRAMRECYSHTGAMCGMRRLQQLAMAGATANAKSLRVWNCSAPSKNMEIIRTENLNNV